MSNFLSWLANLTRRRDDNALAAAVCEQLRALPDGSDPMPVINAAVDAYMTPDDLRLLRKRIAMLPARQRSAIALQADGLNYKQIAHRLGIDDSTALRELTNAMYVLRWGQRNTGAT